MNWPYYYYYCAHGIFTCRATIDFCVYNQEAFFTDQNTSNEFIHISTQKCWHSKSYNELIHLNIKKIQQKEKEYLGLELNSNKGLLAHLNLQDDEEESPLFAEFRQSLIHKLEALWLSLSFFQFPGFSRWNLSNWAQSTFQNHSVFFPFRSKNKKKSLLDELNISERSFALATAFVLPLIAFSHTPSIEQEMKDFWKRLPLSSSAVKWMPPVPLQPALLRVVVVSSDEQRASFTGTTTFELCLKYGPVEWTIHRKFIDFVKLHALLSLRQFQGHLNVLPPFPFHLAVKVKDSYSRILNRFQNTPNSSLKMLEEYLMLLTRVLFLKSSVSEFAEFLEISAFCLLSFRKRRNRTLEKNANQCTEEKNKEGYLRIKFVDERQSPSLLSFIGQFLWYFSTWPLSGQRRWVYLDPNDKVLAILEDVSSRIPLQVIIMTKDISASISFERLKMGILSIKPSTSGSASMVSMAIWNKKILFSAIAAGEPFSQWIPYFARISTTPQPSFWHNQKLSWFIDASSYFSTLAEVLEKAQNEICIMGWWISPELYLKRPAAKHPTSRLDLILKRKADAGVKIFILLFKEWPLALYLNSRHTKEAFEAISPNIMVQRHPDHLPPSYWAHHEKLVIVDNSFGFIGGVDLCFGRYDDQSHFISENFNRLNIIDPTSTSDPCLSNLKTGQLNHIESEVLTTQTNSLNDFNTKAKFQHSIEKSEIPLGAAIVDLQHSLWEGQDYYNPRFCDFKNVHQYQSSLIDRAMLPRMPWHDVHLLVKGSIVRESLYRFFCERWNFIKWTKSMHRSNVLPWLFPSTGIELMGGPREIASSADATSLSPGHISFMEENKMSSTCTNTFTVSLFPLHSRGPWSAGIPMTDQSIYNAYIDLIENSMHYIYIENQFFISNPLASDDFSTPLPENAIAAAIASRIERAFSLQDSTFRVIIIIPLLPAFEFDRYMSSAASLRIILDAQLKSLRLLRERLASKGIPIDNYLSFFSLRTYGYINNQAVCEQIYVHSKLMIVDGIKAIVGSPNINDRSMLGDRDSEIAFLVEGKEAVTFLLEELISEHLGEKLDCVNFRDAYFYFEKIRLTAEKNVIFYREIFAALPDEIVVTWEEYNKALERQQDIQKETIRTQDGEVRGNLILYPVDFLSEEGDLATVSWRSPEYLLPNQVFW